MTTSLHRRGTRAPTPTPAARALARGAAVVLVEAGQGIVCRGDAVFSYEQEPIGLACPAGDVVISGTGREHMTRWHTADGRATRTIVNLGYPQDVSTLEGEPDGPSLTSFSRTPGGSPTSRGLEFEAVASTRGVHDTVADPGLLDALVCEAIG